MTEQITFDAAINIIMTESFPDVSWWVDEGIVYMKINGRRWQIVESPKEKLKRLVNAGASKDELLDVINELENE